MFRPLPRSSSLTANPDCVMNERSAVMGPLCEPERGRRIGASSSTWSSNTLRSRRDRLPESREPVLPQATDDVTLAVDSNFTGATSSCTSAATFPSPDREAQRNDSGASGGTTETDVSTAPPTHPSPGRARRPTSPPLTARKLKSILRRTESNLLLPSISGPITPPVPGLNAELERLRRENTWLREVLQRERQNAAEARKALLELWALPKAQLATHSGSPTSASSPSPSPRTSSPHATAECNDEPAVPRRIDSLSNANTGLPSPPPGRSQGFFGALEHDLAAPSGAPRQQLHMTSSLAERRQRRRPPTPASQLDCIDIGVDPVPVSDPSVQLEPGLVRHAICEYDPSGYRLPVPSIITGDLQDHRDDCHYASDKENYLVHDDQAESTYSLDGLVDEDYDHAYVPSPPLGLLNNPRGVSATRSSDARWATRGDLRVPKFSTQRSVARKVGVAEV